MLLSILVTTAFILTLGYIVHLHIKIKALSYDPTYGCLTRPALDQQWRSKGDVIFLDLDEMKRHNTELGYTEVDRRIRAALASAVRQGEGFAGRWYSGDEIVVAVPTGLGTKVAYRLLDAFRSQGLTATLAVVSAQQTLAYTVQLAADKVQAAKAANEKDQVV